MNEISAGAKIYRKRLHIRNAITWWAGRFMRNPRHTNYLLRVNNFKSPTPRKDAKWLPHYNIIFLWAWETENNIAITIAPQDAKCAWARGLVVFDKELGTIHYQSTGDTAKCHSATADS